MHGTYTVATKPVAICYTASSHLRGILKLCRVQSVRQNTTGKARTLIAHQHKLSFFKQLTPKADARHLKTSNKHIEQACTVNSLYNGHSIREQ